MYHYEFELSKYKLREYEMLLAEREVEGLFPNIETKRVNGSIELFSDFELQREHLKKLTFFSRINNHTTNNKFVTNQVIIESLKNITPSIYDFDIDKLIKPNTSREIRYITHSFHEYKGRFYPQLAKSFMNYANLNSKDTILDPFCGSGTTLLESLLNDINAVGIDINPIAYLLTKSKIRSLFLSKEDFHKINDFVKKFSNDLSWQEINIELYKEKTDLEYLVKWFPEINLKQIIYVLDFISEIGNQDIQLLLKIVLSNILKEYSYQDPSQLRIRRRKDEPQENLLQTYCLRLSEQVDLLTKFQSIYKFQPKSKTENYLGDVRQLKFSDNTFDAVITSPPYATALPYVDTDRLSLFVFNYTNRETFKQLEKSLIGNREILKSEREKLDIELEQNFQKSILPKEIINLLEKIYNLNKNADVGFRRKNTAALLYKYFVDMDLAIKQISRVLKQGKFFFNVVGDNRTTAGDEKLSIPTIDFINLIAQQNGFEIIEKINMTVQKPYEIHSKNSINSEAISILRKK